MNLLKFGGFKKSRLRWGTWNYGEYVESSDMGEGGGWRDKEEECNSSSCKARALNDLSDKNFHIYQCFLAGPRVVPFFSTLTTSTSFPVRCQSVWGGCWPTTAIRRGWTCKRWWRGTRAWTWVWTHKILGLGGTVFPDLLVKVRATLQWKAFGNDPGWKIISTRSPILVIKEIVSNSGRVNQFSNNSNTWFVCTAVEVVELLDANQFREVLIQKRGPIEHGNNNVPVLISNQLWGIDYSWLLSHFHQILQTIDYDLPVFLFKQTKAPVRRELCVTSDEERQLNRLMKSNHNPPQEILRQRSKVKFILHL